MPDAPNEPRSKAPAPLVAPAERERAIARLSEAFAHDILAIDELERRMAAVYRAESSGELAALTADLPATLAAAPGVAPLVPAMQRIGALFSSVERTGILIVPERLEIRVAFGSVELDLRQARFAAGVTEIEIRAVFGSVEIRVPTGVQVENDGRAIFGSFESRGGRRVTPVPRSAPIIRLTGRSTFASVEVISADE